MAVSNRKGSASLARNFYSTSILRTYNDLRFGHVGGQIYFKFAVPKTPSQRKVCFPDLSGDAITSLGMTECSTMCMDCSYYYCDKLEIFKSVP